MTLFSKIKYGFDFVFVDQIWIILNLYELLGRILAESREIALKMTFLGNFTVGMMFLLLW